MAEIKKQIALGQGHHVDSLAMLSGCQQITQANWSKNLQSGMTQFYDAKDTATFSKKLDAIIESDIELKAQCSMPNLG